MDFFIYILIQYNEYTIIEHVSTPVPTMDNRHTQVYMYRLRIYNLKNTAI